MDFKYKHIGKVRGGKAIYDDPLLLQRFLMTLEGEDFEMFIRKKRIPATSDQIKFYIGIVLTEAHKHDEFLHYNTPKDIHDRVFAPMFLQEYVVSQGKLTTKIKSLKDLNKEEIWELTERVIAFLATDFGIVISEQKHYK